MKVDTSIWVFNGHSAYYMGIDPGASGGVWLTDRDGNRVTGCVFDRQNPLLVLKGILGGSPECVGCTSVALEKVHAMPGQGVTSMFTFGEGYGRLQGYMEALGIGYNLVRPQQWQIILPEGPSPKERVRLYCEQEWGLDTFLATKRSRVPHQGMMDAACMAAYLRLKDLEHRNGALGPVG